MADYLARAESLARRAHAAQVDKSGAPYVEHLAFVADHVAGDDAKTVAWLHDIVEDTEVTLDDLRREGFPEHIVAAVDAHTHRAGEAYLDYVRRAAANPLARQVKTQDVLPNMDLSRLPEPGAADVARLHGKYIPALRILIGK